MTPLYSATELKKYDMLTALSTLIQDLGKMTALALIVSAYIVAYLFSTTTYAAGVSFAAMLVAIVFFQTVIYPPPLPSSSPGYDWFDSGYRNFIVFIVSMVFCCVSIAVVALGATKHLS